MLLADPVSPGAALKLIRTQTPTDEPHPVRRTVPPGKSPIYQRARRELPTARTRGGGEGQAKDLLSLTLDAEYKEYRGQGKRATPEDTFNISPFRLRGKEAKFRLLRCPTTYFEKGEAAEACARAGEMPPSGGFHGGR